jgi:Protein of unknown function, DUF481
MKKFLLFLMALLFGRVTILVAQLNESDTAKMQVKGTVTGNYQKGNVEILSIRGKFDFTLRPFVNWVFKSQNASLYQEFYRKKTDSDIFSRNFLYYKPEHRIYPYAITFISTNYRRKIDMRYFAGLGITYQLLQKKEHVIKLSANMVYEHNSFSGNQFNNSKYNNSNTINTWRGTLFLNGWNYVLNNHIRFWYDAYWQPSFSYSGNYRTQYDIGLEYPLWKGLSFTSLYTFSRENIVIKDIKQEDGLLTFGITYNYRRS